MVTSAGPSPNLRSKLNDKAKVTPAMIQELQAIDQESVNDEQCSEATQDSDLEQEDSKNYLTDNKGQ